MTDFDVGNAYFSNAFAGEEVAPPAFYDTTCGMCRFWLEEGGGWVYCQAQVQLAVDSGCQEHPVKHGAASACPQFQRVVVGVVF